MIIEKNQEVTYNLIGMTPDEYELVYKALGFIEVKKVTTTEEEGIIARRLRYNMRMGS